MGYISVDPSYSKNRVSFSTVTIREYEIIIGDHPVIKVGPPISLGWSFVVGNPRNIDEYECKRERKGVRKMSSVARRNLLQNIFDIPAEDILAAEKSVLETHSEGCDEGGKGRKFVKRLRKSLKKRFSREKLISGFVEAQDHLFLSVM